MAQACATLLLGLFTTVPEIQEAARLPSFIAASQQGLNGVAFVAEGMMQGHQVRPNAQPRSHALTHTSDVLPPQGPAESASVSAPLTYAVSSPSFTRPPRRICTDLWEVGLVSTQAFTRLALNTVVACMGLMLSLHLGMNQSLVGVWGCFWVFNGIRAFGALYHHFFAGPLAPRNLRKLGIDI